MKKINLLIVGIVAMFAVMLGVQAQSVTLRCDKNTIGIGESTLCDVTIDTEAAVTDVVITLSSSSNTLDVSAPTANSKAGWVADIENTKVSSGEYAFKNTAGSTGKSQVFSFTVTLNENARNLSAEDDCGQLCISSVIYNNGSATMGTITKGTGTCFAPTIEEEECVGESCNPKNPETGAFANYLAILAVGIGAIVVILVIRRTSKFYRV